MRLKLTLQRAGTPPVDLEVTADATATVGDVAGVMLAADPRRPGTDLRPVTLAIATAGGPRVLSASRSLYDAGLMSGAVVSLEDVAAVAGATTQDAPAAAKVRILAGPDAGKEFPIAEGATLIGRDRDVDIRLTDPLISKRHARINVGESIEIIDAGSSNGIVIDGAQVARAQLTSTMEATLGDTTLCVVPLRTTGTNASTNPVVEVLRSPRVVRRYPGTTMELPTPPKPLDRRRFPLLGLMAPLIMGFALFMFTRQILAVMMMAMSPLMIIGSWIDSKVTSKRDYQDQVKQFEESLDEFNANMEKEQAAERVARCDEVPSLQETAEALVRQGPLVWTHRPEHDGFLTARLGLARMPSRNTIDIPKGSATLPDFTLRLRAAKEKWSGIDDAPVVADFRVAGAVGIAGAGEARAGVARGVAMQLLGLHSPAELVVAALTSQASRKNWDWLEWMPHTSSPHSPLAGEHLASSAGAAATLLSEIEGIVEARFDPKRAVGTAVETGKKPARGEPSVPSVLVIIEADAPVNRARVSRLAERGAGANVHVLWCAPSIDKLPAACRTFLSVETDGEGSIAGEVRLGLSTHPVRPETLDAATAMQIARGLTPAVDASAPIDDDSDLPRSVSLVGLMGGGTAFEPQGIVERWNENNSITPRDGGPPKRRKKEGTLRALVGHAGTQPFHLDLRTQGPHALVGGTTGAGKSEFLQSWVLGMAAAHSPDRVAFLFVDYKGGAAFADCVKLPHTVGLVTDLSPHLVRRALTSLRAELRYREHLLQRKAAKDLASLERTGDPECPPSLLIIVDEFAALVQEVPQFVDGVVDVAQRGRSLGLHLILATQRPAGVIKDNLRANTNLRIALRMADEEDSNDVLGDKMAAHFDPSIPGRGSAKTGPGRLTPFQTAYAGGWTTGEPPKPRIDIKELAFGGGTTWEAPEVAREEVADPGPNDVARMVSTISDAAALVAIPAPRKPWLPELAQTYDFAKLPSPRTDEQILIGVGDDPDNQRQPTVFYEPDRVGNISVFGTGGSGKSTLLRSIAVAAAVTPRGGPVQVYGLDFGANGLRMLESLPHVGAIISGDDDERVVRLLRMLRDTVDERSARYATVQAGSIGEYRKAAGRPDEPRILLLVDGIGAFRDAYEYAANSAWFTAFSNIAVDGRQVGVHIAMAGDRPNSVPTSVASTIQQRIVLRLAAEDDYVMLGVPKDILTSSSPPGRGILDDNEIQVAVLGASPNMAVQSREIERLAESMERQGVERAPGIGKLGSEIPLATLPVAVESRPVIGVADTTLEPATIDPVGILMVAGPPQAGRTTALATLATAYTRALPKSTVAVLSSRRSALSLLASPGMSAQSPEDASALADKIREQLEGGKVPPRSIAIMIESVAEFEGTSADYAIAALIKAAIRAEQWVVGESESSSWSQAYTLSQPFKAGKRGILLAPGDMDGDMLLSTTLGRFKRADFPPGRGFLVEAGRATKIQMALAGGES